MPNTAETASWLEHRLKARVPFVVVRTSERSRVLPLLRRLAEDKSFDVSVHTLTRGVYDLATDRQLTQDRSLWSALEYAADAFQKRNGLVLVLTDVPRITDDDDTTRQLLDLVAAAEERECSVVVLTADPVWTALQQYGMTVTLDALDADELVALAHEVLDPYRGQPGFTLTWSEQDFHEAAAILRGVSRTQAVNLLSVLLATRSVTSDDLSALSLAKDSVFSDLTGIERVTVREADREVGGLRGLTAWLDQRRPLLTMKSDDRALRPPRGVLLLGVPGCGKSLSAKAVSVRWGLPLYRLDMGSILGMWVGQSENRLRGALAMADRVAPCVLWIDEIEKGLAGVGSDSTGTTTRMVGQFLYWLQESVAGAFVVATANSVATLPPELLRSGRFDAIFFVDLPEDEDRREILQLCVRRYLRTRLDDVLLGQLVELTRGYSGAEIDHAVRELYYCTVVESRDMSPQDYHRVLGAVIPFSRAFPKQLDEIRKLGETATPASGRAPGAARVDLGAPLDLRR